MSKHICPKCGTNTTFVTVAHISQDWEVDPDGNFQSIVADCLETVAEPDDGNIWTCKKCGAEGLTQDQAMRRGIKYLQDRAKDMGAQFWEIAEDSYEVENGLMLIIYSDEAHQHEISHTCINLDKPSDWLD